MSWECSRLQSGFSLGLSKSLSPLGYLVTHWKLTADCMVRASILNIAVSLGVVGHTCDPSTVESETERSQV